MGNVRKVLIVEDEDNLRSIVAAELTDLGYEVYQAKDGEEGFAMAEKVRPDVILSDVVMPKKSGNDLLKELRKTDFGKNIPFIVLTARVNMKDYFEMVKVDGFLEKPFKINGLTKAIESVLTPSSESTPPQKKSPSSASTQGRGSSRSDGTIISAAEAVIDIGMTHSLDGSVLTFDMADKTRKPLLVEDDDRVAANIENVLFKNGYLVRKTSTPARCIEEGVNYAPDIIFLKGIVSGMKASSLLVLLRGMLSLKHVPVAVYGGNELQEQNRDLASQSNVFVISGEAHQISGLIDQFSARGSKK